MRLEEALDAMPVIAILRGIAVDAAVDVCAALIESGIRAIETPLNTPKAVNSIERMASDFGGDAAIGAGTVLRAGQVGSVRDAGGTFVVSPNTDVAVIEAAIASEMAPVPGFATPTEAFAALGAGAVYLKLFPAGSLGPGYLSALNAVLPREAAVLAVGGVGEDDMQAWHVAGAAGFGIGSSLYRPGDDPAAVRSRAASLVRRYRSIRAQRQ